jgi:phage anti-repressor protein
MLEEMSFSYIKELGVSFKAGHVEKRVKFHDLIRCLQEVYNIQCAHKTTSNNFISPNQNTNTMDQLIPINENNGKQIVNARDLHESLGSKKQFADWIRNKVVNNPYFAENEEWTVIHQSVKNPNGGRPSIEYGLTIDCAKKVAMAEQTDKGNEVRDYFIAVEKAAKEAAGNLSAFDIMEMSLKKLRDQEKRVSVVEKDVLKLKAASQTRADYFTVVGYATLHGQHVDLKTASILGIKASNLCKKRGFNTDSIPDPRFGRVRMYPIVILDEVFNVTS